MNRFHTSFRRLLAIAAATACWCLASPAYPLAVQRLTENEQATLATLLETLDPIITAKKQDGTAILLTWKELYAPLDPVSRAFLDACRALKAAELGATSHYFGELPDAPDLVPVGTQVTVKNGVAAPLDPQYLPRPVHEAYERMMAVMEADLGKRLLVESGYRSPAYQLYLFLYYLPKHDYSIVETNRFVALPGHSEHGYPDRKSTRLNSSHSRASRMPSSA